MRAFLGALIIAVITTFTTSCVVLRNQDVDLSHGERDIFSDADIHFMDFSLGDTKSRVLDVLGVPEHIDELFSELYDGYIYVLFFSDFGYVHLMPSWYWPPGEHKVYIVRITSEKIVGPRGTRVGDASSEIINSFFVDNGLRYDTFFDERILYSVRRFDTDGVVRYDDYGAIQSVTYFYTAYTDDGRFEGLGYFLSFGIENDVVISIWLGLLYLD